MFKSRTDNRPAFFRGEINKFFPFQGFTLADISVIMTTSVYSKEAEYHDGKRYSEIYRTQR